MSAEQNLQYQSFGRPAVDADPSQTGQSNTTRSRKKYPREYNGAKNEWHALIRHQADVNNQIIQIEKELKHLQAQDLEQAYQQKFQQQIQAKQQELQQKRLEEAEMNARIAQFQRDLAQQKQDKLTMQNILADSYDNLINHHAKQSNEEKKWKLEQEARMLEESRRRLESEQRRKLQAKQEFTEAAHDQINKFYGKKFAEKQDHVRFREEYNQLVNQNIQRDILKEENYRNLAAEQQRQREELHMQNVLSDHLQKEQRIQETIENRVQEANRRAYEMAQMQNQMKERARNDLKSTLLHQMDYKSDLANTQRQIKSLETEDTIKKLEDYQKYLQDVKSQQNLMKQNYKDILDKQYHEQEERKLANRMTKHEKKLNNLDLQAYKQSDNQLHSLIPGLQHSKYYFNGSPALKKLAQSTLISPKHTTLDNSTGQIYRVSTDMSPQVNTKAEQTETFDNSKEPKETLRNLGSNIAGDTLSTPKNKFLVSPTSRGIVASPTYITSTNNALSMQLNHKYETLSPSVLLSGKKTQDPIKENIFYRPPPQNPFAMAMNPQLGDSNQVKKGGFPSIQPTANMDSPKASSLVIHSNSSSHNPITNPLPFTNQNPYIQRQLRSFPHPPSYSQRNIGNVSGSNLVY